MISSILLATALLGQTPQTPDWREAKMPVPRTWTQKDQELFEETAHGDPVYILRQQYGIRRGGVGRGLFAQWHRWSPLYPPLPRFRHYYLYR